MRTLSSAWHHGGLRIWRKLQGGVNHKQDLDCKGWRQKHRYNESGGAGVGNLELWPELMQTREREREAISFRDIIARGNYSPCMTNAFKYTCCLKPILLWQAGSQRSEYVANAFKNMHYFRFIIFTASGIFF